MKTYNVRGFFEGFHMDDGAADIVTPFAINVKAGTHEQARRAAEQHVLDDLEYCDARNIQITETREVKCLRQ